MPPPAPLPHELSPQNNTYVATSQPPLAQFSRATVGLGKKKKLLLLAVALVAVISSGSAAAYFAIIVPNQPDNVWSKALQNMGRGSDKLIDYTNQIQKTTKGITAKGDYVLEGSVNSKASIDGSTYGANGTLKSSFELNDGTVGFEIRSLTTDKSNTPDIYFKLSGVKSLSGNLDTDSTTSQYQPIINAIDNQWIVIDHTYWNSYFASSEQPTEPTAKLTAADTLAAAKALNEVNKQWLWTDDKAKAVLVIAKKIGKEKQDNRTVYHYSVHLDKGHTKQYLKALRDKLKNTKLSSILDSSLINSAVSDSEIDKKVDAINTSKPFDVWVDMSTKLIHKIRFGDNNGYLDIGQDYQGGDQFPFSITTHEATEGVSSGSNIQATLNTKDNTLKLKATSTSGKNKFTLNLTISQNTSNIDVQKPAGAKSITEMLSMLGYDDLAPPATTNPSSSASTNAQDIERQTDIKALHGQIEAYYAREGKYPTLGNLNDGSWRKTNMEGLDTDALKDPAGSTMILVASPTANAYAYAVGPALCDNSTTDCDMYTLTAILSDGSHYNKLNLN